MTQREADRGWEDLQDVRARFRGDNALAPDGSSDITAHELLELIDFYLRYGNEHYLATCRKQDGNPAWPHPDQVHWYFETAKTYLRMAITAHNRKARNDRFDPAILERGHELVKGHTQLLAARIAEAARKGHDIDPETAVDPKEAMAGIALTRLLPKIPLGIFTQATAHEVAAVQKVVELLDELRDVLATEPEARESTPASGGHTASYLSCKDLMKTLGIPSEKLNAVENRLKRLRKSTHSTKVWIEADVRSRNHPRFMYNLDQVKSKLDNLLD